MSTDDLTAALDQIRERGYRNGATGATLLAGLSDAAAVDVPLLLAAIETVLKLHQPHPVKWTNPCGKHWDFAGDYSACTDCEHIAYIACTRCRNTEDEPARFGHCEVRETVRAALTGEKPGR
jgi:hypothetical protein